MLRRAMRVLRLAPQGVALALLLTLHGCATLPPQPPLAPDDLAWAAAGAGLLQPGKVEPEDPADLLRVTDEMRRFAREAAGDGYSVEQRTLALADALTGNRGLRLQYDAEATLGAAEAFRQRRANCLGFTLLFVALAREVEIPAVFNEVLIPPVWDIGDETTSLLYLHVNARVDRSAAKYQIIDVSGDEYRPNYEQYAISDAAAEAQYYNNRAAELRLARRHAESLRYQVRALQLAPDTAYLWNNLASLYLQMDNPRAARIAVTQALALDASSRIGYDVAAQVYARLGEKRLADYFRERARYFLEQNPYHHYQLALAAWRDGDAKQAYEEVHAAILLERHDARFFFLLAAVLEKLGKNQLASDSLQVAMQMMPDEAQQLRYRNKFERIARGG